MRRVLNVATRANYRLVLMACDEPTGYEVLVVDLSDDRLLSERAPSRGAVQGIAERLMAQLRAGVGVG